MSDTTTTPPPEVNESPILVEYLTGDKVVYPSMVAAMVDAVASGARTLYPRLFGFRVSWYGDQSLVRCEAPPAGQFWSQLHCSPNRDRVRGAIMVALQNVEGLEFHSLESRKYIDEVIIKIGCITALPAKAKYHPRCPSYAREGPPIHSKTLDLGLGPIVRVMLDRCIDRDEEKPESDRILALLAAAHE